MKNSSLLSLLILALSLPVNAALYRWVDGGGKVHYSDKIPPKDAQNGHTKLRKNGTTKEKIGSVKIRKRKLLELKEEKKHQKARAKIKKIEALQEMRDLQLLSMFGNVEELKSVYSSKISLAEESIILLKMRHKKLSNKLEKVEARYEWMVNPADKRKLGMKIEDMLDNLQIYQQAITENLIESGKLDERFERDLARFKEITESEDELEPKG